MSFRFRNTEIFLTRFTQNLLKLTKKEIESPRNRVYKNKDGNRVINQPIDSSGKLKSSLTFRKKIKNVISEKGFRATQSYSILGNSYGEIIDEGASGDKINATVSGIEKWIEDKPVRLDDINKKTKIARLIKNKINREGIKPTNFLVNVINKEFKDIFGIQPKIVEDVSINLDDIFVSLGWERKGNTFIRKVE
tara:strand:- start:329 stop:907 length:579 start_codon:yes stop_codon:yes gene_type:complete